MNYLDFFSEYYEIFSKSIIHHHTVMELGRDFRQVTW